MSQRTPLAQYADALRATGTGSSLGLERKYAMFTMPLWVFLEMMHMESHEELLEAGKLVQFVESLGRAIFVSHQWLGRKHPDPTMEQLLVLRKTLMNLVAGTSRVSLSPVIELWFGRLKLPSQADFTAGALYIWYDYFCIPQSEQNSQSRHDAISSIPSYISQCFFFMVLIPPAHHEDGHTLSEETWEERGWCRLESMAHTLTAREDGFMIKVQMASNPTLAMDLGGVGKPPGEGRFSVDSDRNRLAPVLQRLMWGKLHHLIFKGDFHNYRFMLNLQRHCFRGLEVEPWGNFVPNMSTEIDPSTDPHGFVVARFLHENGFATLKERDKAGWSPMCYAVLRDDPFLIEALALKNADVNDSIRKAKNDAQLLKGMSIIEICGTYSSNKAMKALLLAKANVNQKNSLGGNALTASIGMGNTEGMRILCNANVDPNVKLMPGTGPFKIACGFGGLPAIQEMMLRFPEKVKMQFCLHFGIIFHADVKTVAFLIEQSADVNEQLEVSRCKNTGWWLLLQALSFRHRLSSSALTYLANNHNRATPLMLSIITAKFDCTSLLLSAGARLDLKNSRGKTADDIVKEILAPISLEMGSDLMLPTNSDCQVGGSSRGQVSPASQRRSNVFALQENQIVKDPDPLLVVKL
eukprot:Skav227830  [mRNA]  locus=scaffold948:378224:380137:+ [translate_table: standard]